MLLFLDICCYFGIYDVIFRYMLLFLDICCYFGIYAVIFRYMLLFWDLCIYSGVFSSMQSVANDSSGLSSLVCCAMIYGMAP